jgi:hypothetical protein
MQSTFRARHLQSGMTTIQVMVLITVIGLAQLGWMYHSKRILSEARGRAIGGMEAVIRTAVDDYLKVWTQQIAAGKPVSNASVTVVKVLEPTLDELTALGHLNSTVTTPPHGGSWRILIETVPSGCTLPGACNLTFSVWATDPIIMPGDATRLDQVAIDAAVNEIGANGGYSEDSAPATIIGLGGWNRPNKNGSIAGTLQAIGGYGSTSYVAPVNIGDTCATVGAVATSTTGQQLICRGSPSVYVPTVNSLPSYAARGVKVLVKDGDIVNKPTCDPGGAPAYSFEVNQSAIDLAVVPPLQAQYAATDDLGGSWRIKIRLKDRNTTEVSGNTYNITAILHVECYYQ